MKINTRQIKDPINRKLITSNRKKKIKCRERKSLVLLKLPCRNPCQTDETEPQASLQLQLLPLGHGSDGDGGGCWRPSAEN